LHEKVYGSILINFFTKHVKMCTVSVGTWNEYVVGAKLGSSAEDRIALWLHESGMNFKVQREFPGLVGVCGKPLRYDFSLWFDGYPEILLEYQGPYHNYLGCNEMGLIGYEHDRRKQNYALFKKLPLIQLYIGLSHEVERQALFGYINWQKALFDQRQNHEGMMHEDLWHQSCVLNSGENVAIARHVEKQRILACLREEHDVLVYEIRQLRVFIDRLRILKQELLMKSLVKTVPPCVVIPGVKTKRKKTTIDIFV